MKKLLALAMIVTLSAPVMAAKPAKTPAKKPTIDYMSAIQADQRCMVTAMGVKATDDIKEKANKALTTCYTPNSAAMKVIDGEAKNNKVKVKDIAALKKTVGDIMVAMAVQNVEYCDGMQKKDVDSCMSLIFGTAGEQRLP